MLNSAKEDFTSKIERFSRVQSETNAFNCPFKCGFSYRDKFKELRYSDKFKKVALHCLSVINWTINLKNIIN